MNTWLRNFIEQESYNYKIPSIDLKEYQHKSGNTIVQIYFRTTDRPKHLREKYGFEVSVDSSLPSDIIKTQIKDGYSAMENAYLDSDREKTTYYRGHAIKWYENDDKAVEDRSKLIVTCATCDESVGAFLPNDMSMSAHDTMLMWLITQVDNCDCVNREKSDSRAKFDASIEEGTNFPRLSPSDRKT